MVLQGIHRKPTQRCTHHPISYKLLQQILHHLKQSYPDLNHTWAMLQTAVSLTFHGLLCVSKFTSPSSRTIIPQCTLSRGDIHFQHNGSILLHVNASKTDQQQVGNHILIGATGTCTCLVYLIRSTWHSAVTTALTHTAHYSTTIAAITSPALPSPRPYVNAFELSVATPDTTPVTAYVLEE